MNKGRGGQPENQGRMRVSGKASARDNSEVKNQDFQVRFLLGPVSSDPRLAYFEKNEIFSESGLTKRKRVVYLCPIAPDDGDVGGCGAEKILKKMDFGFDKAEKRAIFHLYAPEALRLDEAVLKKF